jgi:hypothetical protein
MQLAKLFSRTGLKRVIRITVIDRSRFQSSKDRLPSSGDSLIDGS